MYYCVIFSYDDEMSNGSLQEQLDVLRSEVRALGSSVAGIKREDFARAYAEQIRSILLERIDRALAEMVDAGGREEARSRLVEMVDRSVASYQVGSKEQALSVLDEFQEEIVNGTAPFNDRRYSRLAQDLIRQIRSYLELEKIVNKPTQSVLGDPRAPTATKEVLSPVAAEKALAPLASSWRMNILMLLSMDSRSLAELSKELGMKTGHLQFHLKTLEKGGYVRKDRKGGKYRISLQGVTALDGLRGFMYNLVRV
jgi:DNA-binding transcriptional ArsR family regulator